MNNTTKLGFLAIVAGIAYTAYLHLRIKETNEVINASIDDVSKDMHVDISQAVIDRAIDKAVDREVNKAVRQISYEVTENMRKEIKTQVRASVNDAYSDIRKSVSKQIADDVARLDMDELKREVREQAKDAVLEKFNENLDSMLQDVNQNLTNVSKIYSSIADSMVRKPQETILKIGQ